MYAREFRASRLQCRAWRQRAEQLSHAVPPGGLHHRQRMVRTRHYVRDDLRLLRIGHRWFKNADDGGRAWTEPDGLANHRWVALEHSRPEPVREHRHACRCGAIVASVQQAAEHGTKSHDLKK